MNDPLFIEHPGDKLNILLGVTNLEENFINIVHDHMLKMDNGVLHVTYLTIYDKAYRIQPFINFIRYTFPEPMWPYIQLFYYDLPFEDVDITKSIEELLSKVKVQELQTAVNNLINNGINFKDYVKPVRLNVVPH